ncbi:hypothetical protein M407DRAFT_22745 [Tulasnella calospora MUT 4182]|uniref:Uncharacterized protein n=1 Tax=Tulasnella calospora MUT 4182 TaxID=1051891 RepID=A0A0C3M2N8_9AGAM|nr:hypothetical protein M407DRAFT_22745 [Tulasnella calospora MUT 4182]
MLDLIISPIASQSKLVVKVGDTDGDLWVLLTSYPQVTKDVLGDWDDSDTGISIKLFPSTVEKLRNLVDGLILGLRTAHWAPKDLHLALDVAEDALSTKIVLPLLCRFPIAFQKKSRDWV